MESAAPRFVYSPGYYCDIGDHVFRTEKYGLLYQALLDGGLAQADDFAAPQPASRTQLELVHTRQYVDDLLGGAHTDRTMQSEMMISPGIVAAFRLGAGGTILAGRLAVLGRTLTMNLGGGLHHAFDDWAEGFCYINDVALGVAALRAEGLIERAMVVDCDLHQGNGTAHIFRHLPQVFTFSIHQQNLYPLKRRSDLDIGLPDYCAGPEYLRRLRDALLPALDEHRPDFVLYVAGADPYGEDLLGSLQLSLGDMKRRDELVLGACAERAIPAASVLAGGYSPRIEDTVKVHYGTAQTVCEQSENMDG